MCRIHLFEVTTLSCHNFLEAGPEPSTGIFNLRGWDILEGGLDSGDEAVLGVVGRSVGHNLQPGPKKIIAGVTIRAGRRPMAERYKASQVVWDFSTCSTT